MENIVKVTVRLSLILAVVGVGLGFLGTAVLGTSIYVSLSRAAATEDTACIGDDCRSGTYTIRRLPALETPAGSARQQGEATPAPSAEAPLPAPDAGYLPLSDATPVLTPTSMPTITPTLTSVKPTAAITAADLSIQPVPVVTITITPWAEAAPPAEPESPSLTTLEAEAVTAGLAVRESYTSTDQVAPPPDPPQPIEAAFSCPATSRATFDLIPIEGAPTRDHPAEVHGDLNLALRGYITIDEPLELVRYDGPTEPHTPQLSGLFEPNRGAQISSVYRVNDWIWDSGQCGGHPRGCPGPPVEMFWPVTAIGLATRPGEAVYIPERGPEIHPGGYVAMVLYAEQSRITLGYTRRDTVAVGYTIHLENICVDPNLLALYRAQQDAGGWLATGRLPALRNNQSLGVAAGDEIRVALRDVGSFMDPRHRDWWR